MDFSVNPFAFTLIYSTETSSFYTYAMTGQLIDSLQMKNQIVDFRLFENSTHCSNLVRSESPKSH